MFNYLIQLEYLGTKYNGWQVQPEENITTIQGVLEDKLSKIFNQKIKIVGSGRTDAGVHAYGQMANFIIDKEMDTYKLTGRLNFELKQEDISIINIKQVKNNFNARFSAKNKIYRYEIINRKSPSKIFKNRAWHVDFDLNYKLLKDTAKLFIGEHDFSAFRSVMCSSSTTIKTIKDIKININRDKITIDIYGYSFLHNQVRIMIGSMISVARGKLCIKELENCFFTKTRINDCVTAPACGLYLLEVGYGD